MKYKLYHQIGRRLYGHNLPLPKTADNKISLLSKSPVAFNVAVMVLFGIGFLQASFAVFIVAVRPVSSPYFLNLPRPD
jgi:hypothetical protein